MLLWIWISLLGLAALEVQSFIPFIFYCTLKIHHEMSGKKTSSNFPSKDNYFYLLSQKTPPSNCSFEKNESIQMIFMALCQNSGQFLQFFHKPGGTSPFFQRKEVQTTKNCTSWSGLLLHFRSSHL